MAMEIGVEKKMNKKILLSSFFLVFSLFIIPSVIAPDPYTHVYIVDKFCEVTQNPDARYCCANHPNLMKAASMVPDAMVKFYYSEGGKYYKLTHNWNFVDEVRLRVPTGDRKAECFAKSLSLHEIPDGVSHNRIVPDVINAWKMPNSLVHIPTEFAMGTSVIKKNPQYISDTSHLNPKYALAELSKPENDYLFDMMQNAIGGDNVRINIKKETASLNFLLGGGGDFFDSEYTPYSGDTIVAKLWRVFYKSLGTAINKDETELVDISLGKLEEQWNDWSFKERDDMIEEPHGFTSLDYANEGLALLRIATIVVIILFVGINLFLIWRRR